MNAGTRMNKPLIGREAGTALPQSDVSLLMFSRFFIVASACTLSCGLKLLEQCRNHLVDVCIFFCMHNADSRSAGCGTINIELDDAFPDGQCIGQFQFLVRAQRDWVVIYGFFREARAHRFFTTTRACRE